MDKNTITGFVLMILLTVGYFIYTKPSDEQLEAQKRYYDSIAAVQTAQIEEEQRALQLEKAALFDETDSDSVKMEKSKNRYGEFAAAGLAAKTDVVLENELVKITLNSKGAQVSNVVLKEYKDRNMDLVSLFKQEDSKFSIALQTASNRNLSTDQLTFSVASKSDSSVVFSLPTTNGGSLKFSYVLPANSYMLQFSVEANGLNSSLNAPMKALNTSWSMNVPQQEKGREFEDRYAQLYYYTIEDGRDYLNENGNDEETVKDPVRWVSFKDQYFSSIFIADGNLMENCYLKSEQLKDSLYLKHYEMSTVVPFENGKADFRYFFGPNNYKLLKSYNDGTSGDEKLNLHRSLTLGFFLIRWVNQFFIIPLFDFFGSMTSNYGLVILLLTLVVKLFLTPLTYKSYLSSAKMRALKPEIDALNAKFANESPMVRSQKVQEFYKDAGVNPAGGCLPMLLSMPFLMAVYFFIPLATELRHVPFLWADDLSSYDAIISWGYDLPLIGDHLSLFCLLMTITNVVYTKFNMQMNASSSMGGEQAEQQMKMMKYMMYLMPIIFFFWFNKIASGLTYYYFVSLLLTIIQTIAIRKSINEGKLLKDIEAHRKSRVALKEQQDKAERMTKQTGSEVIGAVNSIGAQDDDNSFFGRIRKKRAEILSQMEEAQKRMEESNKNKEDQNDKH